MNTPNVTIQVDFKKARRTYQTLGGGLYVDGRGRFFERPKVGKVRTIRRLQALTEKAARIELARKRVAQADSEADPRIQNPYQRSDKLSFDEIADLYLAASCPKRNGKPREGEQLTYAQRRVAQLQAFFGKKLWTEITMADCDPYYRHRSAGEVRKNCSRARLVDLELDTLSNVFGWAVRNERRTGVTGNPFRHDRPRYRDSQDIRHCRECQPASGDELHRLAAHLFADESGEVLGFQMLLEAFTGRRTHEVLKLRWDARTRDEAGHLEHKTTKHGPVPVRLWFEQSRTHKGVKPWIAIEPHLRELLQVMRDWRDRRYPTSPWFFPSRTDPLKAIDKTTLTKALQLACRELGIPHRTSHGLRSYHVNVLRSDREADGRQKISDAEIADRIGHKSVKMLVDVYGAGDIAERIHFLPSTVPVAWQKFIRGRLVQTELPL